MTATANSTVDLCLRCTTPMVPWRDKSMPMRNWHHGRGLCHNCYETVSGTDELLDYPRRSRTADELLDDLRVLRTRQPDITRAEAAQQLGMGLAALDQAITRARRRGVRWTWPRSPQPSTKECAA